MPFWMPCNKSTHCIRTAHFPDLQATVTTQLYTCLSDAVKAPKRGTITYNKDEKRYELFLSDIAVDASKGEWRSFVRTPQGVRTMCHGSKMGADEAHAAACQSLFC